MAMAFHNKKIYNETMNSMKKLLFVFGTRPEAIKLAPLIKEAQKHSDYFYVSICITAQHREMLDQVLDFFALQPDYDLNLMKSGQSLFDITTCGLEALGEVFLTDKPDLVVVQGDTTTAFIGALAGYYQKIPVVHVEAGLRSGDKYAPFPEEMNRELISKLADFHFVPTTRALENLRKEGIKNNVWTVGNTVVDALIMGLSILKENKNHSIPPLANIDFTKKVILVTGHRRENFGEPLKNICTALKNIAKQFNDVEIVYPVHLNPNVKDPVNIMLGGVKNIHLIEPLDYPTLIRLMERSYFVITDSGGIQEEAPALGKPVLVTREVTERTEGVDAGTAKVVGSSSEIIEREATILLSDKEAYKKMAHAVNPYGDGTASKQIIDILKNVNLK